MSSTLITATAARVRGAAQKLEDHVVRTPLERSAAYSEQLKLNVFLKREDLQTTGSFKLRGATHRLLTLTREQRERGCIAASSGNHGAAVACAAARLGVDSVVYVPQHTSSVKVDKIRDYGAEVRHFGTDGLDTEMEARAEAQRTGRFYLSPYNDDQVVAGQGSCGVEMLQQQPDLDVVFVAVGGGGLIGGVGAWLKATRPGIQVVGCQPAASAVMARSILAGEILDLPSDPTLSDGTAGGIEPDAVTFALNQAVVDEYVIVEEASIAAAMRGFRRWHDADIEGAAGVALAAAEQCASRFAAKNAAVVVCGRNVAAETLARVHDAAEVS